jgi:hypothetical protein
MHHLDLKCYLRQYRPDDARERVDATRPSCVLLVLPMPESEVKLVENFR